MQDTTSMNSLRYYLFIIRLAYIFRKKTMIYCQGIGPLNSYKSRQMVKSVLNNCQIITVRDEDSAKLLDQIGVEKEVIVLSDPAFALSFLDFDKSEMAGKVDALLSQSNSKVSKISSGSTGEGRVLSSQTNSEASKIGSTGEGRVLSSQTNSEATKFPDGTAENEKKPLLLVTIRQWGDDSHIVKIAGYLDELHNRGWNVLMVPAHYPQDMEAIEKVSEQMSKRPLCINESLSAASFYILTTLVDAVFSMRLHGLICSFIADTPAIALSYDPKVDAFMKQTGSEAYCMSAESFDIATAIKMLDEVACRTQKTLDEVAGLTPKTLDENTTPTPKTKEQQNRIRVQLTRSAKRAAEIARELLTGAD